MFYKDWHIIDTSLWEDLCTSFKGIEVHTIHKKLHQMYWSYPNSSHSKIPIYKKHIANYQYILNMVLNIFHISYDNYLYNIYLDTIFDIYYWFSRKKILIDMSNILRQKYKFNMDWYMKNIDVKYHHYNFLRDIFQHIF